VPFPAAAGVGAKMCAEARKGGLIVRAIGDTIAMSPPLVITKEGVDEVMMISRNRKAITRPFWFEKLAHPAYGKGECSEARVCACFFAQIVGIFDKALKKTEEWAVKEGHLKGGTEGELFTTSLQIDGW